MAMVRWDPFNEMMTMQRDMNRLFTSLGMPLYTGKGDAERVAWMPTLDVLQQGDDLLIRTELPGVKPDDVDVSVTDDVLTIRGTRQEEQRHEQGEYIRRESSFGSFERQVMLPQGTKAEDVAADYHDGILEITVPHAARQVSPQTRRVPIAGVKTEGGGQQQGKTAGGAQERLGSQTQGGRVPITEDSGSRVDEGPDRGKIRALMRSAASSVVRCMSAAVVYGRNAVASIAPGVPCRR